MFARITLFAFVAAALFLTSLVASTAPIVAASHASTGCHGTFDPDHLYACLIVLTPGIDPLGVPGKILYVRVSAYDCAPPTGHPTRCDTVFEESNGLPELQRSATAWGGTVYPPDRQLV